ncbi:MAG TPA: metallophosphoesterase, partial [Candidatus Sulfotelmatobacter sp.]|nr:metallophosphoesterase [Candidatus Sulfotelmatobacter sp.]
MRCLPHSHRLALLAAALALSSQAAQQIIETDSPLVSKTGFGFTNMYIKYGRVGMGSGDYIETTSGTNASFDYTVPAGNRSVSAMFLFHNQGQTAEVYLDGAKRATVDTFARSSVAQRMGGVVGQIREVLLAADLDPATTHTLRIVNTATSSSDSHYKPRELNQGPQLAVDALRLGDFEFGTVSGVVTDDSGRPLGDLRMTLSSPIGPLKDEAGRSVLHTDGFGRYSFSGLTRGSNYTLAIKEQVADYSLTFTIPVQGGSLVQDITVPCLHLSRPRLAVPAFALRGGTFEIEVDAKDSVSQWSARLRNAYKSVNLAVNSAAYGRTNLLDHSKPGWRLQVSVPSDTPLELWDLEVACSQGVRREPRCVKVMDSFERSFYVAQITDVHCYGDRNAKNDRRLSDMLSTLDMIGARLIAITGDLCHFKGVRQAWGGFNQTLAVSCSDTPTCVLPGNHDTLEQDSDRGVSGVDVEYNHNLYERLIGPPRYDFHMGNVYVLADDIFSGEPDWAGRKLAATTAKDQIRLVLN